MAEVKSYLGDSVYIKLSEGGFVLTTENGLPDDPSNLVFFEYETYKALERFVSRYLSSWKGGDKE
jgi:hypothetical protein